MKRHKLVGVGVLCGMFLLAGCGHAHVWEEATCETPKRCTVCEITEGEAPGHCWKEATCTVARTCEICGMTEGTARAHEWKKETCTEPRVCGQCGTTKGEAPGHNFVKATCIKPETCERCKETRGEPIAHTGESIGKCKLCKLVQNQELVETISSRMQEVYDSMYVIANRLAQDVQKQLENISLPEEKSLEDLGTVGDLLVWMDSLLIEALYTSKTEDYTLMYDAVSEAITLCGEYEELAAMKAAACEFQEKLPLVEPDWGEVWSKYDTPIAELLEEGEWKEQLHSVVEVWQEVRKESMVEEWDAIGNAFNKCAEEYRKVWALFE